MDYLTKIATATQLLGEASAEIAIFADNLTKNPLNEGAIGYFRLKEAHDKLNDARKEVYKRLDFINKSALPEMLEKVGTDKVRIPEIARSFYILPKYSASIIDKEAGLKWLRDRGDGALIMETVNAGTLTSYFRDMIANEGIDPPEDIFKFSSYNTTGVTKYTPK